MLTWQTKEKGFIKLSKYQCGRTERYSLVGFMTLRRDFALKIHLRHLNVTITVELVESMFWTNVLNSYCITIKIILYTGTSIVYRSCTKYKIYVFKL